MSALRELLADTDDDYLVGISNKGIVKRAYKDLEGTSPTVTWEEETASVSIGEESCQIRMPLGESSCSCPSRSICRHVVSAILWLKAQDTEVQEETQVAGSVEAGKKAGEEKTEKEKRAETVEKAEKEKRAETVEKAEKEKRAETVEKTEKEKRAKTVEKTEKEKNAGAEKSAVVKEEVKSEKNTKTEKKTQRGKSAEDKDKQKSPAPKKELLEVPLKKLRTACGTKRYRLFCQKLKAAEKPELVETSTITVTFPKEEIKVKLLEPLSYSTCSCHSKELCAHKAEAILWYQLEKGKLTQDDLEKELEKDKTWDKAQIKELAGSIKEVLKEQFLTGLSRMSPTTEDTMERMAIISHEGNLPEFERSFRQLKEEYHLYFTRNAAFETGKLRRKLLNLYNRAEKLEQAETFEEISRLAGEFRDIYEPVGDLHLMGVGQRHFKSGSGYEGETYYFLELNTSRFYTWTDARPTFYEGRKRSSQSKSQLQAPWGLTCNKEQMAQAVFRLAFAKATKDGRLSASSETKGELMAQQDFTHEIFDDLIACNYEALLKEQFLKGMKEERNQLTFVKAEQVGEAKFDSVNQVFHMELFDKEKNRIYVTVHYTPEEKYLIQALERMQQRIKNNSHEKKVFFGRLYLKDGKCHLYPIECL